MRTILIYASVCLFVTAIACYEFAIWQECRQDHSWLYCVRVLGH